MAFPQRLLTEGEEVVVEMRPHWSFLGWPLVAALAAVALVVAIVATFPGAPVGVSYALLAVLVVAALWLAGRYARFRSTSLILTTIRLISRRGILGRNGMELRLERINQLSFHQSLLGLLLRYGDVVVEVGGEAGLEAFDHVRHPQALQSLITEQVAALHGRTAPGNSASDDRHTPPTGTPAIWENAADQPTALHPVVSRPAGPPPMASPPPAAPPPPPAAPQPLAAPQQTVAERLVQLDDLRQRGILSTDEFETKKAQLLEQL
jgi:Bacterial PH domain/Short C-terminal domain